MHALLNTTTADLGAKMGLASAGDLVVDGANGSLGLDLVGELMLQHMR